MVNTLTVQKDTVYKKENFKTSILGTLVFICFTILTDCKLQKPLFVSFKGYMSLIFFQLRIQNIIMMRKLRSFSHSEAEGLG